MRLEKSSALDKQPDFTQVTETPGGRASREQLSMLYTRYHFAASFCLGKDVLEVACGAGQGIGYLAQKAKKVVGVDIDEQNLKAAENLCRLRKNVKIDRMNAQTLAFDDESFDVVILFEALYYLKEPHRFLSECRRVLRKEGMLLINTVNPEWRDFNPSPFSTRYFAAQELYALIENHGFQVNLYAAFPACDSSLKSKLISIFKRTARNLGLIPKTMKGKEFLKSVFLGKLEVIPDQVYETMADYAEPRPIFPFSGIHQFKVLYAVGQKEG